MDCEDVVPDIRQLVPSLAPNKHKGQAGKVAVVGGCQEYTGAPFFAAYSALHVGADMSQVFCERNAAAVIKSYSPELIVHPYMTDSLSARSGSKEEHEELAASSFNKILAWLPKMSCMVVGPGLGRDPVLLDIGKRVINACGEHGVPVIIDADGLWILNSSPEIVKGCKQVILTPNVMEFQRLAAALDVDTACGGNEALFQVWKALDGPTIVRKGSTDTICSEGTILSCTTPGSLRRCGGQGDVLGGTMAAFLSWASKLEQSRVEQPLPALAAAGACLVTRKAAAAAFQKHKRAMRMDEMFDN
eukprot:CAMPEP_0117692948 /NCGR_PEP_ID=MMETSP0804-20121206/26601_1 /TAXON_ID=1074897 /ORGANISM="Tetraselmis astigmatica, Strain CCMP880" /LENGTH=302 /DNA_ID=CAMNT_0005506433 /DNA_START=351 /DNA_END=1259 /DNA_ORIENTATION=+